MSMRWKTFDPAHREEAQERAQLLQRIDAWWEAFQQRSADLDALFGNRHRWDLVGWMSDTLQAIDDRLMWEYGPGLHSGHRLVITPENRLFLRPLVDEILSRAPQLPGWSFFGHRLVEDMEQTKLTIQGRTGTALAAQRVRVSRGECNRIDVSMEFPDTFLSNNRDLAFEQAFIACESLLGEDMLNRRLGLLETTPLSSNSSPFEWFPRVFRDQVRLINEGIQDKPLHVAIDELAWSLWKLESKEADDYPEQYDLIVGRSAVPEMWNNAHSGTSFYSERFSRCGEIFCYVKIDGADGLDEERFEDKAEIEDALDAALRPLGVGCVVGGGTGMRYSYVDLAVTDVERATELIRRVLREGNIPQRSWILFFDSEWRDEWIGIWETTPAPPGISEGSE